MPIMTDMSDVPYTSTANAMLALAVATNMAVRALNMTRLQGQMVSSMLDSAKQVQRSLMSRPLLRAPGFRGYWLDVWA